MSAMLVHGGAGRFRDADREAVLSGVRRAAYVGWAVLDAGGPAVEAVEAATRTLEDDPLFNAGFGSSLNEDGEIEVDALIMDGQDLAVGAVAAVPRVRHPVTLARLVMTDCPHDMLAGRGAELFARQRGLVVPVPDLVAPAALADWSRARDIELPPDESALGPVDDSFGDDGPQGQSRSVSDTVGAVAVDADMHVAAATSTGGMRRKWAGRVGDSPIIGSGAYADDRLGAASCTGHGERIMRVCMAYSACSRLSGGVSAQEAAESALLELEERTGGRGGLVVVDNRGDLGWAWNTPSMPFAWRDATGHDEDM